METSQSDFLRPLIIFISNIIDRKNSDPQSLKQPGWSPYTYTLDNPIRYIDPDGEYVETVADIALESLSYEEFRQYPGWITGVVLGADFLGLLVVDRVLKS